MEEGLDKCFLVSSVGWWADLKLPFSQDKEKTAVASSKKTFIKTCSASVIAILYEVATPVCKYSHMLGMSNSDLALSPPPPAPLSAAANCLEGVLLPGSESCRCRCSSRRCSPGLSSVSAKQFGGRRRRREQKSKTSQSSLCLSSFKTQRDENAILENSATTQPCGGAIDEKPTAKCQKLWANSGGTVQGDRASCGLTLVDTFVTCSAGKWAAVTVVVLLPCWITGAWMSTKRARSPCTQ